MVVVKIIILCLSATPRAGNLTMQVTIYKLDLCSARPDLLIKQEYHSLMKEGPWAVHLTLDLDWVVG